MNAIFEAQVHTWKTKLTASDTKSIGLLTRVSFFVQNERSRLTE